MKRIKPNERRVSILDAAVRVAERHGYISMTRQQIADEAGVSGPLVQHYFHTMPKLRRAVMRHAVKRGCLPIIAQGLVAKDEQATLAPEELKRAALGQF